MADLPTSCSCLRGEFRAEDLDRTFIGVDDLGAEVSVEQCRTCGRNWLHYLLELEGVSHSGRWYRGLIGPDVAFSHRNAPLIYAQLPEYWAGGSRFEGKVHRRSGPIDLTP